MNGTMSLTHRDGMTPGDGVFRFGSPQMPPEASPCPGRFDTWRSFRAVLGFLIIISLVSPSLLLAMGEYDGLWIGSVTVSASGEEVTDTVGSILYQEDDETLALWDSLFDPFRLTRSGNEWLLPSPLQTTYFGFNATLTDFRIVFQNASALTATASMTVEANGPYIGNATYALYKQSCRSIADGATLSGLSGSEGSWQCYQVGVPSGATQLTVQTSGGTGDVDLVVGYHRPSFNVQFMEGEFTQERVDVPSPSSGIWYILLVGSGPYSGVSLSTLSTTSVPPTYIVTPAGGTGGTVSPAAAQTVRAGATQSFEVTASGGYTRDASVGGTCPQGNWSGSTWTTGAITANCTVTFGFAVSSAQAGRFTLFGTTSSLVTIDPNSGAQTLVGSGGAAPNNADIDWDPRSNTLFGTSYANAGVIQQINPITGVARPVATIRRDGVPMGISALSFSPNGDLYCVTFRSLGRCDLATETFEPLLPIPTEFHGIWPTGIDISPTGKLYVVYHDSADSSQTLVVMDLATLSILEEKDLGSYNVDDIDCAPDGYIYHTNYSYALFRIDPGTGLQTDVGFGHLGALRGIASSGDHYVAQVQKMYVAYYGRPGDPGGVDYWAGRLAEAGGNWIADLVNAFGTSAEYTERFGGVPPEQLVDNLYTQLFNRTADPVGRRFYTDLLRGTNVSGFNPSLRTSTLAVIALDIANGAINQDAVTLQNKVFVSGYFTEGIRTTGRLYTSDDIVSAANMIGAVSETTDTVTMAIAQVDTFMRQAR